jgi:hypothetical protein
MSSTQQLLLGEGAGGSIPVYIEEVFSTYLYQGNGSTQTITNNIDLSTKGGLVWIKNREDTGGSAHALQDTVRGVNSVVFTNSTGAAGSPTTMITAFNSTGFSLGSNGTTNQSDYPSFVSWTFREQPKFFDIVTYTGTGSPAQIAHNLGSAPGCIITKRVDSTSQWAVWHRSGNQTNGKYGAYLNDTGAYIDQATNLWGSETNPPDMNATTFGVGTDGATNSNGFTYIAYIFAHDAGGFGLAGTDNVISCGSYVGNGSATGPVINLGYEPQWVMVKRATDGVEDWEIYDIMRGIVPAGADKILYPNNSTSEQSATRIQISATGFSPDGTAGSVNTNGKTYIYIAIRRGPMKVPTVGTSVYYPFTRAGNDTETTVTGVGFTPDLWMVKDRTLAAAFPFFDRLRGVTRRVESDSTNAEQTFSGSNGLVSLNMNGITIGAGAADGGICNDTGSDYGNWLFKRAPSFFDEVCYTGTGSNRTISHNLAAVPELMIVKQRSNTGQWAVYSQATGNTNAMYLEESGPIESKPNMWNSTTPTASVFSIGTEGAVNTSAATYVAYLFATCAGVSKIGSFTGTGATQTINCGFTGGARFVLIKRTDFTGSYTSNPWYVWDTARGMVSGTDPSLRLNSTAAEVNADSVYTIATGFQIVSTAVGINQSGGSYIFLAIA